MARVMLSGRVMTSTLLSLAAVLVSSASLAAEPTAMFVQSTNLDAASADTFGAICAAQYGLVSHSRVLREKDLVVPEGSDARAAAVTAGAKEQLELSLVSLATSRSAGRILTSAVLRDAEGKELAHAELAADSLDDAPVVCERLAQALVRRVDVAETLNHKNVTTAEAKATARRNRIGSEKIIGVKTSFGVPLAVDQTFMPMGSISVDARLEQDRFFFEFGGGFLIPGSLASGTGTGYGGLELELGASYYLTDTDVSVYVGGGVQPRLYFSSTIFGLAPYAQVGLMLPRHSSTRFYVDARVSQNVLPVSTGVFGSMTTFPTEITLQAGIGF